MMTQPPDRDRLNAALARPMAEPADDVKRWERIQSAIETVRRLEDDALSPVSFWMLHADAIVLANEVDRLERDLQIAEMMRDAWMAEYNRVEMERRVVVVSASSTSLPLRVDKPADSAGRTEG